MSATHREKARLKGCARWHPAIAGGSSGRLIDVDSAFLPEDFASLKCSHLASLAQIGRLEKLEPTITTSRYKILR